MALDVQMEDSLRGSPDGMQVRTGSCDNTAIYTGFDVTFTLLQTDNNVLVSARS
jgi:hypothetical protein